MDHATAANAVFPFGRYAGKRLSEIAETKDGMKYLDWLRTKRRVEREVTGSKRMPLDDMLDAFFDAEKRAAKR